MKLIFPYFLTLEESCSTKIENKAKIRDRSAQYRDYIA